MLAVVAFTTLLGASDAEAKSLPPAESRIALVIGNARYASAPLANPVNDARLIAAKLKRSASTSPSTTTLAHASSAAWCVTSRGACRTAPGASVFYYAGHGVQIDGRNYLLPVDVKPREDDEVKDESVDLDDLFVSRVDRAPRQRAHRHPRRLPRQPLCRQVGGKTRSLKAAGGLAEMSSRGTLVAFASAPGAVGRRRPHGQHIGLHAAPGRRDDARGCGGGADVQERARQGAARHEGAADALGQHVADGELRLQPRHRSWRRLERCCAGQGPSAWKPRSRRCSASCSTSAWRQRTFHTTASRSARLSSPRRELDGLPSGARAPTPA